MYVKVRAGDTRDRLPQTVERSRTMRDGVPIAAAFLLVLGAAALPARAACPPTPMRAEPPAVRIVVEHGLVTRDDTLSLADLARRGREDATVAGEAAARILGLTRSDTEFQVTVRSRVVGPADDGGTACAIPEGIEVKLALVRRVIHIAREIAGDPCLRDEVLAHEMRHVAIDDALLNDFRSRLLPRFRQAAAELRPAEAATAEAAQRKLLRDVQAANGAALADFEAERRKRQRAIDSPKEQARFARVCGGRARTLLSER